MTGTQTRSFWYVCCGLLLAGSACSNDRFVVVGRLHQEERDASTTQGNPDAASAAPPTLDAGPASQTADAVITTTDGATIESTSAGTTTQSTTTESTSDSSSVDTGCSDLEPAHRYSFDGTGSSLDDLSGGEAAELRGGSMLTNAGSLTLDGDDDFVALPPYLLNDLTSVTVMLWVIYDGGPAYVRLFDFGTSSAGIDPPEGEPSVGRTYLALTPATGYDPPGLTALAATDGSGSEVLAQSDAQIGDEALHQVTVVLDGIGQQMRLYLDGAPLSQSDIDFTASEIENANNWLGRSQYDADPYTEITYDEVRIYNDVLPDCAIEAAYTRGPDTL